MCVWVRTARRARARRGAADAQERDTGSDRRSEAARERHRSSRVCVAERRAAARVGVPACHVSQWLGLGCRRKRWVPGSRRAPRRGGATSDMRPGDPTPRPSDERQITKNVCTNAHIVGPGLKFIAKYEMCLAWQHTLCLSIRRHNTTVTPRALRMEPSPRESREREKSITCTARAALIAKESMNCRA